MDTLHMKVGSNLGEVLLDIAQTKIKDGNPEAGINTYIDGLCGFTKEYALMVLKNRAVLVTDKDGEGVNLTDSLEEIEKNAHNILDWEYIVESYVTDLQELSTYYWNIRKETDKLNIIPWDFNINEYYNKHTAGEDLGLNHLCARVIANNSFNTELYANGESVWEHLEERVESCSDDVDNIDLAYYWVTRYVKMIRQMHSTYMKLANIYDFLLDNEFIKRYIMIESTVERVFQFVNEFLDPNKGYYHPMCDEQIYDLKEKIREDFLHTRWGNEYFKNKILTKNPEDNYDAGWISPEGEVYAGIGETGCMIHMNLAEDLWQGKLNHQMCKDGVTMFGSLSPEQWLIREGWIKFHHDEVYGYFKHSKGDDGYTDYKLYCPTEAQVNAICKYIDANYNGKFYTDPEIFGSRTKNTIYSTYKVKQMDEFMLHDTFMH